MSEYVKYSGVAGDYLNSWDSRNKELFNNRVTRYREYAKRIKVPLAGDTGLARMFLKCIPNKYLYENEKTYYYNGVYWEVDETDQMRKDLEDVVCALEQVHIKDNRESDFENYSENGKDTTDLVYKKYRRKYLNNGPRNAALKEICSRVSVKAEIFDTDPLLLNTPECTINFHDNKVTLQDHNPNDFITGVTAAHYRKDAPVPENWNKLMSDIFKDNIREAEKRFGYAITGTAREQIMLVLRSVGEGKENGANGKSTVINGIKKALGSFYAPQINVDVFLKKTSNDAGKATPELLKLKNARFPVSAEPEGDIDLDESRLKQFTGNDSITIRNLYKQEEEFVPAFVPIMTTNYNIGVAGATNNGLWRRLEYMSTDLVVPDDQKDKDLPKKIAAEADGIMFELVTFAKKYFRDGLFKVEQWQDSKDKAVAEFNPLEEFIKDTFSEHSGGFITTTEIYQSWLRWADPEQKKRYRHERSFAMALAQSSFGNHKTQLNGVRGYENIKFGKENSKVISIYKDNLK